VMTHRGALVALTAAALFVVASCGYILAAGRPNRRVIWYIKPFAMPLLGLAYVLACRNPNPWILGGLGCGAAGDVFLIRAERSGFFLAGLAAFLLGHLAYLVAFMGPVLRSGPASPWVFAAAVPLAAFGVAVYRCLRPGLGRMKLPVALYTVVILGMALAALLRVSAAAGLPFWLPLFGALCFIASDTLLAWQRFRGPILSGRTLVALTYIAAQTLIVLGYLLADGLRTR
jgi:uncharacterized membrane protein YhhN